MIEIIILFLFVVWYKVLGIYDISYEFLNSFYYLFLLVYFIYICMYKFILFYIMKFKIVSFFLCNNFKLKKNEIMEF